MSNEHCIPERQIAIGIMATKSPTNAHSEIDILSDALHGMMIDSGFVSKVHIAVLLLQRDYHFHTRFCNVPFEYVKG